MSITTEAILRQATTPLTAAETEAISGGKAVLAAVRSGSFPWPAQGAGVIRLYADELQDCLAEHEALRDGSRHPASVFPDLGHHQHDALGIALERVTEDIGAWTGALLAVLADLSGGVS